MSGCAICVHDLYQESLSEYSASVAALRASLVALGVPEAEWPADIQTSSDKAENARKDVSGDAFAAMERALKEKKEAAAGGPASS